MNSMPLRRAALPAALLVTLAAAAAAWAEPARTTALSSATPIFEWDSGGITGTPLGEQAVNDDTLIELTEAGTLGVVTSDADDTAVDVDVQIYKSDATGEPQGEPIVSGEEGGPDESVSAKNLKPGHYLVRIFGWASVDGHVHGKATFKASAPPAEPAPDPGTTPQLPAGDGTDDTPVAKLGKVAKKIKAKKLKRFAGTASDDRAVAKVEVALVRKKGSKCYVMTSKGGYAKLDKCSAPTIFNDAEGTTSWSFALPKKLKKGSYTVFARATDSGGQVQAGYSAENRRSFKVK